MTVPTPEQFVKDVAKIGKTIYRINNYFSI